MDNGKRSLVIFDIWGWDRRRLQDFVDQYINIPIRKYGIAFTPEELFIGTCLFIRDFDLYASKDPGQPMENLEDYLDELLNNFTEEGDEEFMLDEINRRRILTAFNDLSEFLAKDVLIALDKAHLDHDFEIMRASIRRKTFTLTIIEPGRISLW